MLHVYVGVLDLDQISDRRYATQNLRGRIRELWVYKFDIIE